jgi:3-hydroxybutyrate dehydrogenase
MGVVRLDLQGRTAMVTGGGSGIGQACAARLAQAGAKVLVVDRDGEAAGRVAASIGGVAYRADLTDRDELAGLPDGVDVLVNNAGLQHVSPVEEFDDERFGHLHEVMLWAAFRLSKKTLPHMYSQGWGRIVNISSVHGLRASAFKAAYVSAKHGLEGLTKVIAVEAAPHGVTANCINPAYVRTPLVEGQIADQARTHGIPPAEVVEKIMLAKAAIKRLIEPAEVAELAAYLCTPAASFITGTSIAMDGGWTAQ